MQIQLFTISVSDDGSAAEGLNRFLRSHRVLAVDQQLAVVGGSPCWCFCVRYLDHRGGVEGGAKPGGKKQKVDYKESLSPEAFTRFSALRKIRKQIAADALVPAYAVFTDAELAQIASLAEVTLASMRTVKGVGQKKVEKYGALLMEGLKSATS